VAVDVDGDGDIDIAEAKWTAPSTIYLNDGKARFTDSGAALGLPQDLRVRNDGMSFGDVDNDGDLDLVVMGPGGHGLRIYKNSGNFFSWSQTISDSGGTAHVCLGDFDHDGDLDLYPSGGNVFENDGMGLFSMVMSHDSGMDPSLATIDPRGSGLGDLDNDGDLDIYLVDADNYCVLLQNDRNNSDWIQVDIRDHTGAAGGIGTKLDLYEAGRLGQPQFLVGHREVLGEYGYLGQDMPTVHFGAPASSQYDLRVTFFDGSKKEKKNISPGQKIQVSYSPPVYAPLNLAGEKKENRALFYIEHLVLLTWQKNPQNTNIEKYRIYRVDESETVLLDEISPDNLSYIIRNVVKNKQYLIAVTAVDSNNVEGDVAYVTVY
jgi:hypothetical protein